MMTIRSAGALAAAGLSLANVAFAHHGFGNFDTKSEVAFEGTITGIDFVNPHAYVYFDVVGAAIGTSAPTLDTNPSFGDPKFANAAAGDYSLGAGSAAAAIGFQSIDQSQIGPHPTTAFWNPAS